MSRRLPALMVVPLALAVGAWPALTASASAASSPAAPSSPASPSAGSSPATSPPAESSPSGPTPAPTPEPATRLVGLPASTVVNGTAPLTVRLSAPVSPTSPVPTVTPNVGGSWSIVGDAEVFKPADTLLPCSNYTLTVWARTDSTGYAQLGQRRTVGLHVACPPIAGVQQALARLGYLGATFRPLYRLHYPLLGKESRREAAEHAYHPPRGRLAPDPSNAPPA